MISFFKTIRLQLIDQYKIKKYVFYAIGEIILVVIGILIALEINNWNNLKIKKQDEITTYKNIKEQITQNLNELNAIKATNNYYTSQYSYASSLISALDKSKIDTLAIMTMNLSQYSDFHGNGSIYETLVNSGDIKLLENSEIQNKLQALESTYGYINKLEDIHWEIIIKELSPELRGVINYANLHVVKPEKLYSVEIQNIFIESIFLTNGKETVYNLAINAITELIELINKELESLTA
jgi:hypothetical protein